MAADRSKRPDPLPPDLRHRLEHARLSLLSIHKALLDHERSAYESIGGPVAGAGAMLQAVIHDPFFAWLRPLSELIVQVDEYLASDDAAVADGEALEKQAAALLRPSEEGDEFAARYFRAMQDSPAVVMAHADWKRKAPRPG